MQCALHSKTTLLEFVKGTQELLDVPPWYILGMFHRVDSRIEVLYVDFGVPGNGPVVTLLRPCKEFF
jgi:hypothetical protein